VVNFDFEITLLTVSAVDGVHFCAPVGHRQEDGDYRESWQPQQMSELALARARRLPAKSCWRLAATVCLAWSCSSAAMR
jgi:phosphoribosylglycinamide formyltransferase 2